MITAKEARRMADKVLEDQMIESRNRIEKEIREAAARGEDVIRIDGPILQDLIVELQKNGFNVEFSFYMNEESYTISW